MPHHYYYYIIIIISTSISFIYIHHIIYNNVHANGACRWHRSAEETRRKIAGVTTLKRKRDNGVAVESPTVQVGVQSAPRLPARCLETQLGVALVRRVLPASAGDQLRRSYRQCQEAWRRAGWSRVCGGGRGGTFLPWLELHTQAKYAWGYPYIWISHEVHPGQEWNIYGVDPS